MMREMRTLYGTILAAAVAVAVVVQAEANDAVWTNKTANGAVSWNAAAALAFALTAQAEFKIDRSVMSEKYWALWNDEVQAMIDADIEANRKADGMFDLAAPDGGGVKGEPLVSGLFTRDMQKKPFLPESYLWRHPDFRLIYTTDKIQFGYFSRRERESSASYFR